MTPSANVVNLEPVRKWPPYSMEAESSVLGGLLLDNKLWPKVTALINEGDFYRADHQMIYRGISEVLASARACDFVTLSEHLRSSNKLEAAGGLAYLGSLAANTHSVANVPHYAGIIRQHAMLRQLIAAGTEMTALGYRPENRDIEDLLSEAQGRVDAIRDRLSPDDGAQRMQPGLADLLKHYVMIYGTETVFDEVRCRILPIGALRAAAGVKTVKKWSEHPGRRTVDQESVVFDPAGKPDSGRINLFRGWPLKQKAGECGLLLELLAHLCNEGELGDMQDWLLNWFAYPLQNPGSKMQTAVIWHGPEGAGKNLFLSALRAIYGEYGVEIGQNQIEGRFNGWASRKLLIIGNEIISRSELKHVQGQLKQWITEPQWMIEEKNLPARQENNHANIMLLSNSMLPAMISQDDRRFAVVWTPTPKPPAFYAAVRAQLDAGGIEAFYDMLLTRDLSGFNEHNKPPDTESKRDLKRISKDSYLLFFDEWQAGDLPVPHRPCAALDLYRSYVRWCTERGIKNPAPDQVTNAAWKKLMPNSGRKKYRAGDASLSRIVQSRLFMPTEWAPKVDEDSQNVLGTEVAAFNHALKEWKYDHERS